MKWEVDYLWLDCDNDQGLLLDYDAFNLLLVHYIMHFQEW